MDTDTAVKHTPGPWERNGGSIIDARGNVIAQRFSRRHIERGETWADCIEPVEADANARLIASAPALLAALKALADCVESHRAGGICREDHDEMLRAADAAIQQAAGA